MNYVNLGKSGLKVSRLCLGCMSYGVPERGTHAWSMGEDESRPYIKQAIERGINFFDTANAYSDGTSEEIVGRWGLASYQNPAVTGEPPVTREVRPGKESDGVVVALFVYVTPCWLSAASVEPGCPAT